MPGLHLKRVVIFAIVGLVLALVYGLISPKVYEGRVEMIVGNDPLLQKSRNSMFTSDVEQILERGYAGTPATEINVLRGQGVFLAALRRAAANNPSINISSIDAVRDLFQKYDVVAEPASGLAIVTVRAYDPKAAVDIANEVSFAYSDVRRTASRLAVSSAQEYVNAQVDSAKKDLEGSENRLRDYKQARRVPDVLIQGNSLIGYQTTLLNRRDEAKSGLKAIETEIREEEAALKKLPKLYRDSESIVRNPVLQQLESNLTELQRERARALTFYLEDHQTVRAIDQQIAKVLSEIAEAKKDANRQSGYLTRPDPIYQEMQRALTLNKARFAAVRDNLGSIQSELDEHMLKMAQHAEDERQILQLTRERDIQDGKYRRVKMMTEEFKDRTEAAPLTAQLVSSAEPNDEPVAPNVPLIAVFGLVAGSCLGFVFSFGYESLKMRVYTSSQVTELTGLPVSATLPKLPSGRASGLTRGLAKSNARVLEGARYLAASTLVSDVGSPQTVLLTGVGGDTGCSSVAGQYAVAMARLGKRVVLVDYDFQNGTLTRAFGMEGKTGLAELLTRSVLPSGAESTTFETSHPNLRILPTGKIERGAVVDVPSDYVGALIEDLKRSADVIVIDSAPCDVLSDASRVAAHADEVLLVLSASGSNYPSIMVGRDILTRAGAKRISVVLNHANTKEEAFTKAHPVLQA